MARFHLFFIAEYYSIVCLCVQISVFLFLDEITRSYGSSILNFLRNIHIVFHSCCTNLHSHQQWLRGPFSPHPLQHLLFLIFLMIVVLVRCKVIAHCGLICIFLIIGDFEHLFMYLLSTCMSSFEKCLLSSSAHFSLGCFLLLSCMSSLYILYINPLLCVSFTNIFSHSVGSSLCYWWFSSLCRLLI